MVKKEKKFLLLNAAAKGTKLKGLLLVTRKWENTLETKRERKAIVLEVVG